MHPTISPNWSSDIKHMHIFVIRVFEIRKRNTIKCCSIFKLIWKSLHEKYFWSILKKVSVNSIYICFPLRLHWRLSMVLKTSNKSLWGNVFWYVKVHIFWKFIKHTIHWDKMEMLKQFPLDKINVTRNAFFSFASSNSSQFYF